MKPRSIAPCLPSILAGLVVTVTAAQSPRIDNRAAKPGEWGYHPADGESVLLNPPTFTWLHENDAVAYTVQWSTRADLFDATSVAGFRWPTYTHHTVFAPGTYYWRYRYQDRAGEVSNWSVSRRVVVPEDATGFPMPTVAQQRERVPIGHPRLFVRPVDLPELRKVAEGRGMERFAALRAEADRVIAAGPTPEPDHLGSARDKNNPELIQYWWPNRVQTLRACEEAEVLAFVYLITREPRYGEAARKWILHLTSWDPDGPTNFGLNCEAAKPMLHRLPRAYDWAYAALSPEDREVVRRVMLRRVTDAWNSGEIKRGVGHLNEPYNSHGNRVWHKVAEAGIAFLGDIPEAELWLDYAVNKFYACYPVWSDADGGWHEGVSYWAGYMSKAVWWLQFAHTTLGIDGLRKPFFAHVGDFPLYVAPPHSPNSGFGDLAFRPPSSGWGGFLEFLIRAKSAQPDGERAGYWRWWAEQWGMRDQDGILGFLYLATLPDMPPSTPPTDLPQSKVFRGIGVASLHTTLLDSRDDVHFLFKSSPFGTQSHGHNPHNSFQLNAYGEALLTTCVYRDLHGSKFHYQWAHSTVAHNALLVDGQGQRKHTASPDGNIVAFESRPEADYVAGEAAAAYEGRLKRYTRRAVLVKGDTPFVVLLDEIEAVKPATYQFMLHALAPFGIDEGNAGLQVTQPKAGAVVRYLSSAPLRFRQWDGYEPPPTKEFPNQWHVEAGTTEPLEALNLLTVIVPYRAGEQPEVNATRADDASGTVAVIVVGGEKYALEFNRNGGWAVTRP
ncbi:MAG: DUF4962 domain-containing protein [Verrucomicrobiales bacterium]|nr:DUF4962 domain-containing protein [Verrucomicrobiales bacterium]